MVVVEGIESKGEAMVLSMNKVGSAQGFTFADHSTNDSLYHLRSERIWK
jgi:EAL domain-containing protein (putative c-di-GMP-specific phosphodiesterase class I)